ncbi:MULTISPECIES: hypothetical protein [Bacillus cereus group]|uniref:Uncharacterized protein n=1 Tax=Bacillus cereus (strain G9842) TaxID=405531 RepID=B7IZ47_BACC2|nr:MULTISPECIES: hypothetical protein [Bacillus cereus group]ACK98663.1 conserved hypothetical protein [Bacillus cereus G9842]MDR4137575.1 hypothetical protein [Bacillus cereus]MDR4367765.1 hypothetical protein [Bacillus cereus]PEE63230.1 hypothetical protein COM74_19145 [Bacillus thuringiensis]PFT46273.1 hypothetical protein COK63_05515 [Bacillus cereus]
MKKIMFLAGIVVLMMVFFNLKEDKNDPKLNAEMNNTQINVNQHKLDQAKINELASQIKMLFDDVDTRGHVYVHQSLGALENYLAANVTSKELAKNFVEEHFINQNGKIIYKSKPFLFDYEKNRTVRELENETYSVKQNNVVLTFKYNNDANAWRIVGIAYLNQ